MNAGPRTVNQEEAGDLEIRGEQTAISMRIFLAVVFGIGTLAAYSTGAISGRLVVYYIVGCAGFVVLAGVSALLLRLNLYRRSWKYWLAAAEYLCFGIVLAGYIFTPGADPYFTVRNVPVNTVYFVILTGAVLRFSPRLAIVSSIYAIVLLALVHLGLVLVHQSALKLNAAGAEKVVGVDAWAVISIFLAGTGLALAAAAGRVRSLVIQARGHETDARRNLSSIQDLLEGIRTTARELSASVQDIDRAVAENEDMSRDQMASVEETGATMEQMSASTRSVVDRAQAQEELCEKNAASMQGLNDLVQKILDVSNNASMRSRDTLEDARRGEQELGRVGEIIESIHESSEKVADIVTVINGISDKTNLLALNAAIEAARAGEEGRGFSVVADEVGKLAELSSRNAKEIEKLIHETRQTTAGGVESIGATVRTLQGIIDGIKDIVEMIRHANGLVQEQSGVSSEVAQQTQRIQSMAREVRDAVEEQMNGAREILGAVDALNKTSESFVQTSEKLRRAGQSLTESSTKLSDRAEAFADY